MMNSVLELLVEVHHFRGWVSEAECHEVCGHVIVACYLKDLITVKLLTVEWRGRVHSSLLSHKFDDALAVMINVERHLLTKVPPDEGREPFNIQLLLDAFSSWVIPIDYSQPDWRLILT